MCTSDNYFRSKILRGLSYLHDNKVDTGSDYELVDLQDKLGIQPKSYIQLQISGYVNFDSYS